MNFHRLDSAGDPLFTEAFALYEASFPIHEQRVLDKQTALMPDPLYHFDVIMEDGALVGILLHWDGSEYVYIEHFAIHPSMRGRNMGSAVLEKFCECERHPFVVLEIDPPVDETGVRRERFYHRLGFKSNVYAHTHPAYRKQFPPHKLVVMTYPRPMSEKEYKTFQRELVEIVMKDSPGSPRYAAQ